ncbi:hypothetical protein GOV14_03555 [Candidatus Pacearchaeota archaeon]|nr:hypothetical protein [Candidatus Pacearchaeota archaeon]
MADVLFYVFIGFIAGFILGRKTKPVFGSKDESKLAEMREEAREALSERTEKRKEKILEFMKSEAIHQKELKACDIGGESVERSKTTCNDIEKLLEVSGQTARKYLDELEDENKIKQIGERGRNVYYTLIS